MSDGDPMTLDEAVDWLANRRGTWFGYTDSAIRRVLAELESLRTGEPATPAAAFARYLAYGAAATRLAGDELDVPTEIRRAAS